MRYFIMTCGADGKPAPDKWITDWGWDSISDSHLTNWWSPNRINTPWTGDIVIQASIITGKLLGIFRVTQESDPHPFNPERWGHGLGLDPLLLWGDLSYAPTMSSAGLGSVSRTYHKLDEDHAQAASVLIRHYLPELSEEIEGAKAA